MAAIKRELTPPGPVSDLFERLDDLHSKAGRPSVREIAIRAGRGNISPSTVHNVFHRARVPRWVFLEQVIRALGGEQEREAFFPLWEAAWRAENNVAPPRKAVADQALARRGRAEVAGRPGQRIRSSEIPSRNANFTGRAAELGRLSDNLSGRPQPPCVQVISGMGGVGKTELAAEYIHRNIDAYEIIWWIRAEHPDRVAEALVELGQELGLRQAEASTAREKTVAAVLDTLRSGHWPNWLLVFDNAANPVDLGTYIPAGCPQGHVIITARQPGRPRPLVADGIEVWPFTDAEAVSFLRRAVPGLAESAGLAAAEDARRASEARRLATALGHLPIAAANAAAYLAETGLTVEQYLARWPRQLSPGGRSPGRVL